MLMDKPEGTVSLADFTELALIAPELRGQDAAAVIQELGQSMQRTARVPELLPFYHAVLNREYLISTVLDYGIALPHARLSGLKSLCFALGRSAHPIQWGPKGSMPVRLVFLLAVPSTEAADYLLLMAGLTRLGKEPSLLQTLLTAESAKEMYSLLSQVKLKSYRAVTS
jgi:nitrogen PTS system EIIA component